MTPCTEFAVFRVKKENIDQVIALSKRIFSEMNAGGEVITAHQVLTKTDEPEQICWHLTWIDADTAKETVEQWPTFASTKAFQALVEKDIYYGNFVEAF
ncbi:hypothetical protein A9Q79_01675 [Methylophaga sp. 42_25_T18]|nr:hypothetical protein A9Q79_01675 [Methylophaga sp. 42_25_T18]